MDGWFAFVDNERRTHFFEGHQLPLWKTSGDVQPVPLFHWPLPLEAEQFEESRFNPSPNVATLSNVHVNGYSGASLS